MDPSFEQRHDLAEAVRAANRAVRVTTADAPAVTKAAALVREATELLEADRHPGPHCQVGFGAPVFDGDAAPADFFPYSPIIGPLNPLSPPVAFSVDAQRRVHGTMVLHEGYN